MSNQKDIFQTTRSVLDYTDINRYYIKGVGSIMKNIPIQDPIIEYEHAYVSLLSVVEYFHLFGHLSDNLSIDNEGEILYGIKGTKYAESVRKEVKEAVGENMDPMILYMSIWSDNFEASTHRSNDCSIWIKTVTI